MVGKLLTPSSGGTSLDSIRTIFILPRIFLDALLHAGSL